MDTINEAVGPMPVGSVMYIKGGAVSTFIYRSKESGMWQQHVTFGSNEEFQAWNDASPPFPGWWNAHFNPSDANALDLWRWWDGERWSMAYRGKGSMHSEVEAERAFKLYDAIKWNDRWPDGARVPRMIPDGYENFEVLRGICGGLDLPSTQLALPLDEAKTLQQQLEESDW